MRWMFVLSFVFASLVAIQAAEFDEFDINPDFKIDAPPVTPISTGMENMLHLGINGQNTQHIPGVPGIPGLPGSNGANALSGLSSPGYGVKPLPNLPVSHGYRAPSSPPQAENIQSDLSGWGPLGKLHPKLLMKDKMVHVYHNRGPDPRYTHLQGYGRQAVPEKLQQLKTAHARSKLGFF